MVLLLTGAVSQAASNCKHYHLNTANYLVAISVDAGPISFALSSKSGFLVQHSAKNCYLVFRCSARMPGKMPGYIVCSNSPSECAKSRQGTVAWPGTTASAL